MSKATHNGTCQVCGRIQAATSRGLAKHGYTKELGFFSGTCGGSGHQPVEQSTKILDQTVQVLTERADRSAQAAEGEITSVLHAWDDYRNYNRRTGVATKRTLVLNGPEELAAWLETDEGKQVHGRSFKLPTWACLVEKERRRLKSAAEAMRFHVAFLRDLKVSRAGQPLFERKS